MKPFPDLTLPDDARRLDAFLAVLLGEFATYTDGHSPAVLRRRGDPMIPRGYAEAPMDPDALRGHVPRYSAAADAAEAVIKAMGVRRCMANVYHNPNAGKPYRWEVRFYTGQDVPQIAALRGIASAPAFTVAVALAAAEALWPTAGEDERTILAAARP